MKITNWSAPLGGGDAQGRPIANSGGARLAVQRMDRVAVVGARIDRVIGPAELLERSDVGRNGTARCMGNARIIQLALQPFLSSFEGSGKDFPLDGKTEETLSADGIDIECKQSAGGSRISFHLDVIHDV